jgi:hypothetical protein
MLLSIKLTIPSIIETNWGGGGGGANLIRLLTHVYNQAVIE